MFDALHPLTAIALVAEEKILEAQRQGSFADLPGAGKPLPPDDEAEIPPELRMAHKILKNSGFLNPAEPVRHAVKLEGQQEHPEEGHTHSALRRFTVMFSRVHKARGEAPAEAACKLALNQVWQDSQYLNKILNKI